MKRIYRGFEIEAKREKSLGGWEQIYYTIISEDETLTLEDSFYDSEDKVLDFINGLKNVVDDYYDNPSAYE